MLIYIKGRIEEERLSPHPSFSVVVVAGIMGCFVLFGI